MRFIQLLGMREVINRKIGVKGWIAYSETKFLPVLTDITSVVLRRGYEKYPTVAHAIIRLKSSFSQARRFRACICSGMMSNK